MKHLVMAVALAMSAGAPVAWGQELIEQTDRLGETVLTEAEAIRSVAGVIQAEVDAGRLALSDEARAAWPKGQKGWDDVRSLAMQGEYGPALKLARQVRAAWRAAFREGFDGKPSEAVTEALRAYVESMGPRVDALTRQIENYPLTLEARESYHVGAALWADARKSAKKKDWDLAFRQLMDALTEMDKVILESYPKAR